MNSGYHVLHFWESMLFPAVAVISGLVIGLVFEKILIRYLKKLAEKSRWRIDDILVNSFRTIATLGFVLIGITVAVRSLDLGKELNQQINLALNVSSILLVTWFCSRVVAVAASLYFARIYGVNSTSLIRIVGRTSIFALGILIVLQTMGISITPILTALGVGGLAVALALQDTLTNFFAGIQILATNKYRPGDFIELEAGQNGYITDISWRNVTLRTIHNNLIIIPNSKFSQTIIKNYNFPIGEFKTPVTVGVHYESDLALVEKVTLEVAREVEEELGAAPGKSKPYMWFHTFNDSSIDFNIMLTTDDYRKHFNLKHEFIKRLQTRYAYEGIEIPFPIRNLYFRNNLQTGNEPENRVT